MDMQNVSNLVIPEGKVRTIHDKNNSLLWGKVAYNTKYTGNTIQNGVPTPDIPVPVQTVTGEQTVTVTGDGVSSQSYPISLGSIELCKIGNYQDYIYKSGDDWYVHKKNREKVLDGTETWSSQTGSHTVVSNFYTPTTGWGAYAGNKPLFCSIARFSDAAGSSNDSIINICRFNNIGVNFLLDVSQSEFPTVTSFQTWIENHNVTLYYVIAAPTDTQITDATLIGQLDAIHQFLTRYGYEYATVGNVPVIISRESL